MSCIDDRVLYSQHMSEKIRATSKTEEELAREALNDRLTVFLEHAEDMDFRVSGLEDGDFNKHLFACTLTEMLHDIIKGGFFGDWVGSTGIKLRDGNNTWLEQAVKDKIQNGEQIPEALKKPEGAQNTHSPTGQILLSIMRMMNEPREDERNVEIIQKCQVIQQEKDPDRRLDLASEFFYQETQNMLRLAIGEYLKRKELVKLIKEEEFVGFDKWRRENPDVKVDLLGAKWSDEGISELALLRLDKADARFMEMPKTMSYCHLNEVSFDGATSGTSPTRIEGRGFRNGSARFIRGEWTFNVDDVINVSFDESSVSGLVFYSMMGGCSLKGLEAGWLVSCDSITECDMRGASIGRIVLRGNSRWIGNDLRGVAIEAVSLQEASNRILNNWLRTNTYSRPLPNSPEVIQVLLDPRNRNVERTNEDIQTVRRG